MFSQILMEYFLTTLYAIYFMYKLFMYKYKIYFSNFYVDCKKKAVIFYIKYS